MLVKSANHHLAPARTPKKNPERRLRLRNRVSWQLSFLGNGMRVGFATKTRDLSSKGFYCLSPIQLQPGDVTYCVLNVPDHRSDGSLPLTCKTIVVRVEPANSDGFYGVGLEILDYWFSHGTG